VDAQDFHHLDVKITLIEERVKTLADEMEKLARLTGSFGEVNVRYAQATARLEERWKAHWALHSALVADIREIRDGVKALQAHMQIQINGAKFLATENRISLAKLSVIAGGSGLGGALLYKLLERLLAGLF